MIALNEEATEIFNKLISLAHSNEGYIKIENNTDFMAVCIERLDETMFGVHRAVNYSIAHYVELNGDLMADPEMTFVFLPDLKMVYPSSFKNDYAGVYKESLFKNDEGVWKIWKEEQEDEALFCEDWFNNIQGQQKI